MASGEGVARIRWEHETTKAIAQLKKQITQLDKQNQKLRETARAAKSTAKNIDKSTSAMAGFIRGAVGLSMVTRAIGAINAAMKEFVELKKKAAMEQAFGEELSGKRRLQQVATSASDFQRMMRMADEMVKSTGMSREQARQVVFYGRSSGFADQAITEAGTRLPFAVSSTAMPQVIEGAGKMVANFGPQALGGTIMSNASYMLQAARFSHVDLETVARAVQPAAQPVAALQGGTPTEMLAAYSVLARQMTPDMAANTLARFAQVARETGDPAFMGRGLRGAIEVMAERGEQYAIETLQVNKRAFRALKMVLNPRGTRNPQTGTYDPGFLDILELLEGLQPVLGTPQDPIYQTAQYAFTGEGATTEALRASEAAKKLAVKTTYAASEGKMQVMRNVFEQTMTEVRTSGAGRGLRKGWNWIERAGREWLTWEQMTPTEYAQMMWDNMPEDMQPVWENNLARAGILFTPQRDKRDQPTGLDYYIRKEHLHHQPVLEMSSPTGMRTWHQPESTPNNFVREVNINGESQ